MSSNTLTDLMPRIVARGLLRFREQAILPRLVNSSLSAEAARHGDAIRVPVSQPVTASDVTPAAQSRQAPATTTEIVSVPLDNWKSSILHRLIWLAVNHPGKLPTSGRSKIRLTQCTTQSFRTIQTSFSCRNAPVTLCGLRRSFPDIELLVTPRHMLTKSF